MARFAVWALVWVCAGVATAAPHTAAAGQTPPEAARGIEALLHGGPHPWLGHPDLSDVRDSLRAFYARRDNAPVWVENGHVSPRALQWAEALGRLDDYGIPADDFDAPQLAESLAVVDADAARTTDQLGDLEIGMSVAVARSLRALKNGRLEPALVDSNLILLHRRLPVSQMLDSVVAGGEARDWLARMQPNLRPYQRLLEALGHYREVALDPALRLPDSPPRLASKRPSADVAHLKLTLELTGDLRWGTVRGVTADSVPDAKLTAAVGRYQRRHHLSPTGRLDSLTWLGLHGAIDERIEQMQLTLEQYRWLPHELPAPLLLINIPAFRLRAMTRLDQPESQMLNVNVVVGTAYKTQTPVLTAALTSVDLMPDWDVPPSIATNEVQVEALKDSTYLRRNHMDLIRGMRILPVTPENIEAIGHGVRVRQQPGPENPLGKIKFVMPNRYDIYLHDTPAQHLFQARQRDFSHGCIRLGDPRAVLHFALRDRPDWTDARIDSALAGEKTIKVRLPIPMLVAIVYATSEAREDGRVVFHPDVYGHDRDLRLLRAGVSADSLANERWRATTARHPTPIAVRVDSTAAAPRDSVEIPHPPGVPPPAVLLPPHAPR